MKLVMAAIFVILTAICKRLSIMIPLFGTESLKIGFEYIPLMLAGYFLSPSYCFIIGLSSDLIGLIITPTGFPFFGFTLGTILVCVIPSLVKQNTKIFSPQTIQNIVTILIVLLGLLGSVYVWFLDELNISSTVYTLNLTYKIGIIAICIL
ncbi:MAG: folate family ECF transporter S component, partial [Erysipelotrichaceae bacterium]|nr:folate family ECF transporter S component [Erysipelotrichaceae bacterium]